MSNEMNAKFAALQYDPKKVLVYHGEPVESFKKGERIEENGKYIVIEREKVSISEPNLDIGVIDSIVDFTYPGALLLANTNLVENKPDPITVARNKTQFSIDLPGLEKQGIFVVDNPDYASVSAAVQEKFNFWNKNYADTHSIVARSQYTETMVYNESQMMAKFGFGMKKASQSLNIDFSAIAKTKTSVFIASFRQIFYTVSMSPMPSQPSEVFADTVTWDDLVRYGVDNENPPVFVYKVAYGRTIYVKLESSSTSKDVEGAFHAVMKGVDISGNAAYKNIIDNTSFTAVVIGGGVEAQDRVLKLKDMSEVRNVIAEYSACNAKNPGYPISYATCFLKDNKLAAIQNTAEYVKSTSTEYSNAVVKLEHTGGYVAQFKVTWNEVTYDEKGEKKIEAKGWGRNSSDLTAPFSTEISIPGNSENLCVFAKECTGLAWEWWRTVFDKSNVPLLPSRTFHIYGTTLNQKYSIDPSL